MLTPKQLAEKASLSVGTVYGLVGKGLLPCYRVGVKGGKILIRWEDWEAFLATRRVSEWTQPEEKPRPEPKPMLKHLRA